MAYQTLLQSYIREGLHADKACFVEPGTVRLLRALKRRGVDTKLLDEATKEAGAGKRQNLTHCRWSRPP
jgi:hypothetical protein